MSASWRWTTSGASSSPGRATSCSRARPTARMGPTSGRAAVYSTAPRRASDDGACSPPRAASVRWRSRWGCAGGMPPHGRWGICCLTGCSAFGETMLGRAGRGRGLTKKKAVHGHVPAAPHGEHQDVRGGGVGLREGGLRDRGSGVRPVHRRGHAPYHRRSEYCRRTCGRAG